MSSPSSSASPVAPIISQANGEYSGLPCSAGGIACGSEGYKSWVSLTIGIFCGKSKSLLRLDHRATRALNACGTGCSKSYNAIQSQRAHLRGRLWVYADSWPGAVRHHMDTHLHASGRPVRHQFATAMRKIEGFGVRRGTLVIGLVLGRKRLSHKVRLIKVLEGDFLRPLTLFDPISGKCLHDR